MSQMVTLVCPTGAWDYPTSQGTREYRAYPVKYDPNRYLERENYMLWVVDVPIEEYSNFCKRGGYKIYDPEKD